MKLRTEGSHPYGGRPGGVSASETRVALDWAFPLISHTFYSMARIGAFEELVLLAVGGLSGTGYGVTIQAELERETGDAISLGAVYATLDRLERKGLVRSRVGPATAERGGRRKRLFQVTADGVAAVREMQRIRGRLRHSPPPSPARA